MKLATLATGGPDGTLILVSADGAGYRPATAVAATSQAALEGWSVAEPALQALGARDDGWQPRDPAACAAPLPRAWQWLDGSAYPACSVAPFALTPDALGGAWCNGRVHLPLIVDRGDERFGAARGGEMEYGFHELIAHAASTRNLPAGTIIGSVTVFNPDYREVGSSCIAERRGIEMLDTGTSATPFLGFGERVRMAAVADDGSTPFGILDQRVVRAHDA